MALQYMIVLLLFGSLSIQSESILPNGCPVEFHIHRLLPHETDCGQFYQCSNGQRVLMHCAPGTLFSKELQFCVWPYQATCNQATEPDLPSVSEEENQQASEEQTTSSDNLPNGCPKDFSIHVLLPHESDCDKFYQCSNGLKYLMQCGAGTLFDCNLQICNWPEAVECHSTTTNEATESITEETTTFELTTENDEETTVKLTTIEEITEAKTEVDGTEQTTTESLSEEESQQSTETEQNTSTDNLPNECPRDYSIHILLPHESDCDKFYQCSNGIKYLMQCAAGTLFDYKLQVCNWPYAVECHSAIPKTTVEPIAESTTFKVTTEESDKETTVKLTTVEEITEKLTTVNVAEQTTMDPINITTEESNVEPVITTLSTDSSIPYETTHNPDNTTQDLITPTMRPEENTTVTHNSNYTTDEYATVTQSSNYTTEEYATEIPSSNTTTDGYVTVTQSSNSTTEDYTTATQSFNSTTEDYTTATQSFNSTTEEYDTITQSSNSTTEDIDSSSNASLTTQNPYNSTTEFTTVTESINSTTEKPIITTEAPICPTGVFGNVPHPDRCDAFYLCSGGIAFEVTCASGFEFDPVVKVCVEISEGGCTLGTVTDNENSNFTTTEFPTNNEKITTEEYSTEIPSSDTTTEGYVTVTQVSNSTTEEYATVTQSSNYTTEVYVTITQSSNYSTEDIDSSSNATVITQNPYNSTTEFTTVTDSLNYTTQKPITTTEAPICPAGMFGNVPHPDRCDVFYLCSGGIAFEMTCTSGFEFDPVVKVCVAITEGGCTLGSVTDNDNENSNFTTTEFPTKIENITTEQNATEIPSFNTTTEGYVTVTQSSNSTTDEYVTVTQSSNYTTEEYATEIPSSNTTTEGYVTVTQSSSSTTEIPSSNTTTEEFVTVTQSSNYTTEEYATEIPSSSTTTDEYMTVTQSSNSTTEEYVTVTQSSNSTTEDINSSNNATLITQNPYNSTIEFTTVTENLNSTTNKPILTTEAPICSAGVFGNVPHPDRCDAFYLCSGGIAFEMTCASGFEFDPVLKECVEISQGGCTLGPVTTEENTELSSTTVTNIKNETTTEQFTEVEDTGAETEITDAPLNIPDPIVPGLIPPPQGNPVLPPIEGVTDNVEFITERTTVADSIPDVTEPICLPGVFGNIPHHTRCDAYYLCSAGMAFEVLCPNGYEFNANTKNCAEIADGGCTLRKNANPALKISPVA